MLASGPRSRRASTGCRSRTPPPPRRCRSRAGPRPARPPPGRGPSCRVPSSRDSHRSSWCAGYRRGARRGGRSECGVAHYRSGHAQASRLVRSHGHPTRPRDHALGQRRRPARGRRPPACVRRGGRQPRRHGIRLRRRRRRDDPRRRCSTATVPRDDLVICTKAGISRAGGERRVDVSRRGLMAQLETSLRRLGTDHVDLWLVHTWSDDVPLSETLSALEWAAASGRARYVGVSNYSGLAVRPRLQPARVGANPLGGQRDRVLAWYAVRRSTRSRRLPTSLGFGLLPWSPLGRGVLTGKYRNGIPSGSRAASERLPGLRRALPRRADDPRGRRGGDGRPRARGQAR